MKTFKLHLIRHGTTQGNLDGVFVGGGADFPLCKQGVDELHKLKNDFPYPNVGLLFSSPMTRAKETAAILYPDMSPIFVEEIREAHFGEFEGKSLTELATNPEYQKWVTPESNYVPRGGESGAEFATRCTGGIVKIFTEMTQKGVTEAACITHGGVIMTVLAVMAFPKKNPYDWLTANGCGYTISTSTSMLMRENACIIEQRLPVGLDNTPLSDD